MKARSNTKISGTISTARSSLSQANTESSHTNNQKSLLTITVLTQCLQTPSLAVVIATIIVQTTIGSQIQSIGQTMQMTQLSCHHQKRSLNMTMTIDTRAISQQINQVTDMNITATMKKILTTQSHNNHLTSPCNFIQSIQSQNIRLQRLNTSIQNQSPSTRKKSRHNMTFFMAMLSMEGF